MRKPSIDRKAALRFAILFALLALYLIYSMLLRPLGEPAPKAGEPVTNTDAVYREHYIRDVLSGYRIFKELWFRGLKSDTYVIPGLKSTKTMRSDDAHEFCACTSMTPQGICVTEKYLIISAYCRTKKHNSVLYVLDLETREFLKEIILPGKPHVGGIVYDQEHFNIWICCFDEELRRASVAAIPLETIEAYNADELMGPVSFSMQYPILTQNQASFMCFRDGGLYIGYFTRMWNRESTVQRFRIGDDGGLVVVENQDENTLALLPMAPVPEQIIRIGSRCQGMTFIENLVLISQSLGIFRSKIRCFAETIEWSMLDARNRNTLYSFKLPAMLEQIYSDGNGRLYLIFESAAYAYRMMPIRKVDRVIVLNIGTTIPQSVWNNTEIEEM